MNGEGEEAISSRFGRPSGSLHAIAQMPSKWIEAVQGSRLSKKGSLITSKRVIAQMPSKWIKVRQGAFEVKKGTIGGVRVLKSKCPANAFQSTHAGT